MQARKPDAQHICNFVKDKKVLDTAGKTSLKELLDLFNIGDILITNGRFPEHPTQWPNCCQYENQNIPVPFKA